MSDFVTFLAMFFRLPYQKCTYRSEKPPSSSVRSAQMTGQILGCRGIFLPGKSEMDGGWLLNEQITVCPERVNIYFWVCVCVFTFVW